MHPTSTHKGQARFPLERTELSEEAAAIAGPAAVANTTQPTASPARRTNERRTSAGSPPTRQSVPSQPSRVSSVEAGSYRERARPAPPPLPPESHPRLSLSPHTPQPLVDARRARLASTPRAASRRWPTVQFARKPRASPADEPLGTGAPAASVRRAMTSRPFFELGTSKAAAPGTVHHAHQTLQGGRVGGAPYRPLPLPCPAQKGSERSVPSRLESSRAVATPQAARERAHPPCRHFNNQSCCCLGLLSQLRT